VAIWQVLIEFVPAQWVEENNYEVGLLYGEEGYDTSPAWLEFQPSRDYVNLFDSILPKAESWSEDLELWGESPVHDISVWNEEDVIESIGFRLDLRKDFRDIAKQLMTAAEALGCYFFIPGQKVIFKPDMVALIQYIRQSNAAKFVTDPHGYLDEVSKNITSKGSG